MSLSSHGETVVASPHTRPYGFKEHVDSYDGRETAPPLTALQKEDRKCGMNKRRFFILIACIIIAIISLALGLGLGLGLSNDSYVFLPLLLIPPSELH